MRIALLSALPASSEQGEVRPAFRTFAGKSVLVHQIDCAALLGCQGIVCLVTGLGKELNAAREHARKIGLRFETVDQTVRLASQISGTDELVILADGVLPDRNLLRQALLDQSGVLAFPADLAVPIGYERLDPTRAWSGALRTSGAVISPLLDLPPDCDVTSSLLRIALQRGTPVIEAAPGAISDGSWLLRIERGKAAAAEWTWITKQVQPLPFTAPILAPSQRIGLRMAQDAIGGRWSRVPHFAAAAGLLMAFLALVLGWPLVGVAILFVTSILLAVSGIFDQVAKLGTMQPRDSLLLMIASWTRDILLFSLAAELARSEPAWLSLFLAILLIAVIRLGERIAPKRWRPVFMDRPVVIAVLFVAAMMGWVQEAQAALIGGGLSALLFAAWRAQPSDNGGLTA